MLITVMLTFTEEQALILAKEKGYTEKLQTGLDLSNPEWIDNPQTPGEFLKNVYEAMVVEDSTKAFVSYDNKTKEAEIKARENQLRSEVVLSVTSTVE